MERIIISMYQNEMSIGMISRLTGIPVSKVRRILLNNNIKIRSRGAYPLDINRRRR